MSEKLLSKLEDPQIHSLPVPNEAVQTILEQWKEDVGKSESTLKIFCVKQDKDSKRALAKRSHDVTSALRTLRFALEALQDGYRFDDEMGPAKIQSMEKAINALERESELLCELFQ
jgi:hypothetical protein